MTDRQNLTVKKFVVSEQTYPELITDPVKAWEMMWPLAVDAWAMKGEDVSEFRLPRHVVRIIRRGE